MHTAERLGIDSEDLMIVLGLILSAKLNVDTKTINEQSRSAVNNRYKTSH